jgi:hypothetical protein
VAVSCVTGALAKIGSIRLRLALALSDIPANAGAMISTKGQNGGSSHLFALLSSREGRPTRVIGKCGACNVQRNSGARDIQRAIAFNTQQLGSGWHLEIFPPRNRVKLSSSEDCRAAVWSAQL